MGNRKIFAAFVVVFLLTLFFFSPDLGNTLLDWDDSGYIADNSHIRTLSTDTVLWAFSDFYLCYWAPLTWLSLALDYAFWGFNPFGYHLTNNILHACSAGVFFLVCLELLTSRPGFLGVTVGLKKLRIPLSLICSVGAALFFGIHPLRVESVAWATERKDVLSLFFGLPAVLFYLRHVRKISGSRQLSSLVESGNYWLALVFFALSLMSKSLMVMLPVVLLILDWFPFNRWKKGAIVFLSLEKTPFFLLSGVAAMLTMKAQSHAIIRIDLQTKLLNAFKAIVSYLELTIWPPALSPFYVHPYKIPNLTSAYGLYIAVIVLITLCCLILLRRLPILMTVWSIYLITLLPFLGFTQVGPQGMAGRFTYLSGLPLAILVFVGVAFAYSKLAGSRLSTACLGTAVGLLLFVNACLTVREIHFWKDDVTLWTRVIEKYPDTGRAYSQRSNAYRIKRQFQQALADVNEAISIAERKKYAAMHDLFEARAELYSDMGAFAEAIADHTRALETAEGMFRGIILFERSKVYQRMGRTDLADNDLRLSGMKGRMR